jgi:hypothetical protein
MRYLIVALLAILLFSACASNVSDPQERDFYYGGWMHPDQASERRLNGR